MQRLTRHGELRQKVEVTRLELAMASSKSKQRQEGIVVEAKIHLKLFLNDKQTLVLKLRL